MADTEQGGVVQGNRLAGEIGHGTLAGARLAATPRVEVSTSPYGRAYRVGYGLGVLEHGKVNFELGVDAQRSESPMCGTGSGHRGGGLVRGVGGAVLLLVLRRRRHRRARERRQFHPGHGQVPSDDVIDVTVAVGPDGTCACKVSRADGHRVFASPDVRAFEQMLASRLAEVSVPGRKAGGRS